MSNAHDWWSFSATHSDNMVVVVVGWLERRRERAISPNCSSRRKTRPPLGDRTTSPKWWIVFLFLSLCFWWIVRFSLYVTHRERRREKDVRRSGDWNRQSSSFCSYLTVHQTKWYKQKRGRHFLFQVFLTSQHPPSCRLSIATSLKT